LRCLGLLHVHSRHPPEADLLATPQAASEPFLEGGSARRPADCVLCRFCGLCRRMHRSSQARCFAHAACRHILPLPKGWSTRRYDRPPSKPASISGQPKTTMHSCALPIRPSPSRDRSVSHGPPAASHPRRIADEGAHHATGSGLVAYSIPRRTRRTRRMRRAAPTTQLRVSGDGLVVRGENHHIHGRRAATPSTTHHSPLTTHQQELSASDRNASIATGNALQRIASVRAILAIPYGESDCKFPRRMQRTRRMRWAAL
jgi:hypothetical protein